MSWGLAANPARQLRPVVHDHFHPQPARLLKFVRLADQVCMRDIWFGFGHS
jgi:hypothetical protein